MPLENDDPNKDVREDDAPEKGGDGDDKLAALAEGMTKAVGTFSEKIDGLTQRMDAIEQRGAQGPEDEDDDEDEDPEPDPDDDADPDLMTGKELLTRVEKGIDRRFKGLEKRLGASDDRLSEAQARAQVDAAREKFPDFNEFTQEIADIARKQPTLPIDDMYYLAKARNPEKVAKVEAAQKKEASEKKVAEARKEADDERATAIEGRRKAFGGLTPTSGKATENQRKSFDDASESSWQQHMEGLDVGQAGEA